MRRGRGGVEVVLITILQSVRCHTLRASCTGMPSAPCGAECMTGPRGRRSSYSPSRSFRTVSLRSGQVSYNCGLGFKACPIPSWNGEKASGRSLDLVSP